MSFRRLPDAPGSCVSVMHTKSKRRVCPPDVLERYFNPQERRLNLDDPDSLPAVGHAMIKALGMDRVVEWEDIRV